MSGSPLRSEREVDDDLIEEWVRCWERDEAPALVAFLEEKGPVSVGTLLEVVRVDQDARWRGNDRVPAESYLRQFDALRADETRALDLIHSEVLLREQLGEQVSPQEYYNRFPDRLAALRRQFAVHSVFSPGVDVARVGSPAPDFVLPSTRNLDDLGRQITLADFRGQWLVLFFYPHDFSMVCPTEVMAFSRRFDEFQKLNTQVLGVSTDPVEMHAEWIRRPVEQNGLGGLRFPLASDGTGEVSARYGVLIPEQGVALRGLFIIDPGGILQYQVVHNLAVGRRSDVVLRVLRALQTGGACGESWEVGEPTLDPSVTLHPGTMVSRFQIEELLGEGSFSLVYRALDTKLRRPVALKVLRRTDAASSQRLLAEARSIAALQHPNICVVYEVDDREGFPYIAMQYVPGSTLLALLGAGPLEPRRAVSLLLPISEALAAAHAAHIVHGDLKPHNVIVSENGHVTLVDFGLAKHFSPDPQGTTVTDPAPQALAGTPAYMSPEQIRGEPLSPKSDVFSLGILLFHLATGSLPFSGRTAYEMTASILNTAPVVPAHLPSDLGRILSRMLQRDPAKRYLSMPDVRDDLNAFLAGS